MLNIPHQVERALSVLEQAGQEAYLVGGCVRDALLGKTPADWDVTTDASPERMMELFQGYPLVEAGVKHGTVGVVIDGMQVEITVYRVDGEYSDGRHPDGVRFTDSLEEDLARRDFTFNAIAYHPKRGMRDPFGGAEDLKNGVLRAVGEADRRFQEDALRILRGLRFLSTLGFTAEKETEASMRRNKKLLRNISAERVRAEMEKTLLGPSARRVLLSYGEILAFVIPEIKPLIGFNQNNHWHDMDLYAHTLKTVEGVPDKAALKWAALLHDIAKPSCAFTGRDGEDHFYNHAPRGADMAWKITERLKFDTETRRAIYVLIREHMTAPEPTEASVCRAAIRCGEGYIADVLALQLADTLALTADGLSPRTETMPLTEKILAARENSLRKSEANIRVYEELIRKPHCFDTADLKLDGYRLEAMGFSGRDIGRAKKMLLLAVADGKVKNEEEALAAYAAQWVKGEKKG